MKNSVIAEWQLFQAWKTMSVLLEVFIQSEHMLILQASHHRCFLILPNSLLKEIGLTPANKKKITSNITYCWSTQISYPSLNQFKTQVHSCINPDPMFTLPLIQIYKHSYINPNLFKFIIAYWFKSHIHSRILVCNNSYPNINYHYISTCAEIEIWYHA